MNLYVYIFKNFYYYFIDFAVLIYKIHLFDIIDFCFIFSNSMGRLKEKTKREDNSLKNIIIIFPFNRQKICIKKVFNMRCIFLNLEQRSLMKI